jgi:hypothetical protein
VLLAGGPVNAPGDPVPAGPSIVSVEAEGRRLYVRERQPGGALGPATAMVMRGVNWSPASKGTNPANLTDEYAPWYQTDIPKMAEMGVNVARVYHDFGTGPQAKLILDEFWRYGIKVIVTVDSPSTASSPTWRTSPPSCRLTRITRRS